MKIFMLLCELVLPSLSIKWMEIAKLDQKIMLCYKITHCYKKN